MARTVHVLGIRHHGPGSAASLLAALDAIDPEIVLVEGPPEADGIVPFVASAGTRPPVAILSFSPEDPSRSVFHPFAEFSPEWQALRWAVARGREARFIDWPAAHSIAHERPEFDPADATAVRRDPLGELAAAAGHSDGEAWWDATVESTGSHEGVFAAVEEAMTALREHGADGTPDPREDIREAFMRLAVREAEARATGDVAVVVGAWHVPAIRARTRVSDDRALTRGLPKVKVEATWIPWTEQRLAERSGYAAGVVSPGWYRLLWDMRASEGAGIDPVALAAAWNARAANLLREAGHAASTAAAIDATNLAVAMASLREHPVPGLAEMRDAAVATICGGDPELWRLVERDLVVGREVGTVDPGIPQMPLLADLALWQRRTRLKPETLPRKLSLDLRTGPGLLKSTLLRRLDAIGVPWGTLDDAEVGNGTFREEWTVEWRPELAVNLAEALVYGPTIELAAAERLAVRSREATGLPELAGLVRTALNCDLPAAAGHVVSVMQAASAGVDDVLSLAPSVGPLVDVLRYGSARRVPEAELRTLATDLSARVVAGIVTASRGIDEAAAAALRDAAASIDGALPLLADTQLSEGWVEALRAVAETDDGAPLLRGFAVRRCRSEPTCPEGWAQEAVERALSRVDRAVDAALFLEGFLGRDGEILLHDATVLAAVDGWLSSREEDDFVETLPVLRRAFSAFDTMQRKRLMRSVVSKGEVSAHGGIPGRSVNPDALAAAVSAIDTYFGRAA